MASIDAEDGVITKFETREFGQVRKGYTAFQDDDVILAKITPCFENGKAAIARNLKNGLGFGSSEFYVFRPTGAALSEYLYYYLRQPRFRADAANHMTGTAGQERVPAKYLDTVVLPVPPFAEQRRIVSRIEALLAEVRNIQEGVSKVSAVLKRLRQSVLASACSGRLTADWREENGGIEVASGFVRRVQQEREATYESHCARATDRGERKPKRPANGFTALIDEEEEALPERWCVTRIGDISDCLDHLRVPVNKTERLARQGVIPYYGANGQVGWIDDFLFDEELVLVVEDETFIGREKPFSYVIRGKTWVNNHAHVLRALGGMTVDYLNIGLSYYDFTPLTSGTTGRRKLTQEALVAAPLRLPPLPEQHEIVRRVGALFSLADIVEKQVSSATARAERLTQTMLAKSFRGELVPTEAEVARREGRDYEPASVLLERIRAKNDGGEVHAKTVGPVPSGKVRARARGARA